MLSVMPMEADQPHAQTVLGHEGQPDADLADLLRAHFGQFLDVALAVAVLDAATGQGLQTRDGLQQFLLTAARNACNAQNFAGEGFELDVRQHRAAFVIHGVDVGQLQLHDGIDGIGTFDVQLDLLAHHHFGQAALCRILRVHRADGFALAQHGHAVAQAEHFVEFVGNDQDGVPLIAHVTQHLEQLFRLLRGQNGGGFVQNEHVGSAVKHLDDLHRLLLGHAHFIDFCARDPARSRTFPPDH